MAEENTEATAESPAMSEEERQNLAELKAKEAAEKKAAAEEAAAKAEAERAEEAERIANRPLYHVLVRHMGRSARTRTMRAARAGHRRQGVLLDDGTRVRKRGRRFTEVDLRELANNHQRLLEYVRTGAVEVCDPKTEHAIPYDGLVKMISDVGAWLTESSHAQDMEKFEADMQEWKDACKAEKAAAKEEKREPDLPPQPEKPEKGDFGEVNESGLQDDPVDGSELPENAAPPPPDVDATRPDMGASELLAAVDQHEAEMTGEANPSASDEGTGLLDEDGEEAEEENGLTEEELLAMKLDDLKALAVESYGCDEEEVGKMRAKKDVVAVIFEASEGEE
jgi:hypothetical protein